MRRVGRYEVQGEIARGGMGAVYLAVDPSLQREVAIKFLIRQHPNARERFQREAAALARLRHPHIVGVHDVGEQEGCPFIVMDFVEGRSLQERLNEDGPLRPAVAAQIASKLADALHHAHAEGVLHRDVKPANVVLDRRGEPRLTDFGLARGVEQASGSTTGEGEFLGTPGFWAPEQAHGNQARIGPRTDVYGLGAVLYAMLTGRAPYESADLPSAVFALEQPPTRPSQSTRVDPTLEAICMRCLEREPGARYDSAGAVADELQRWLEGGALPRSRPPRWGGWVGVVGLLALAGIVVAAVATRGGEPASTEPPADLGASPADRKAPAPAPSAPTPDLAADPEAEAALQALFDEAERHMRTHGLQEATRLYDEILERAPTLARAYYLRGNSYHLREMFDEALADYTEALRLEPDHAGVYATRGGLYSQRGDQPAAIADCTRALELKPTEQDQLKALHNRAIANALSGEHLAAIRDCTSALELRPRDAELVFYRALSHRALNHVQATLEDFTRVIDIDPKHVSALLERGNLLAGQRQLQSALADFERVVRIDPYDPRGFICRGNALFHLGERARALADFQHVLRLLPPGDDREGWVRERLAAMQR